MIVHNHLLYSREKRRKDKLLYKKEQIICIFKQYEKYTYTIHSCMFDEVNASYYFLIPYISQIDHHH